MAKSIQLTPKGPAEKGLPSLENIEKGNIFRNRIANYNN